MGVGGWDGILSEGVGVVLRLEDGEVDAVSYGGAHGEIVSTVGVKLLKFPRLFLRLFTQRSKPQTHTTLRQEHLIQVSLNLESQE